VNKPFFSVIIPTYNREARLKKTLAAILRQDFGDFEIIIMDDGGSDNTCKMVNELDDVRLNYYYEDNTGPLIARERAVSLSKGKWLAFCDSDDIWHDLYLQYIWDNVSNSNIDICLTDYTVEGESVPRLEKLVEQGFFELAKISSENSLIKLKSDVFYKQLMIIQPIMLSAFSIESVFYKKIGGIDKNIDVIGSEDSHLTLRASACAKEIGFIPMSLVLIGRGNDNVSANYLRNLEGGLVIMEDILQKKLIPSELELCTRQNIKSQRFEIASQYYWRRDLITSKKTIAKAFINKDIKIKYIILWIKVSIRQLLKVMQ
jgi:glycosyltransferase involved in cell wall biosynthesis